MTNKICSISAGMEELTSLLSKIIDVTASVQLHVPPGVPSEIIHQRIFVFNLSFSDLQIKK